MPGTILDAWDTLMNGPEQVMNRISLSLHFDQFSLCDFAFWHLLPSIYFIADCEAIALMMF